jgi:hypothetical protein
MRRNSKIGHHQFFKNNEGARNLNGTWVGETNLDRLHSLCALECGAISPPPLSPQHVCLLRLRSTTFLGQVKIRPEFSFRFILGIFLCRKMHTTAVALLVLATAATALPSAPTVACTAKAPIAGGSGLRLASSSSATTLRLKGGALPANDVLVCCSGRRDSFSAIVHL